MLRAAPRELASPATQAAVQAATQAVQQISTTSPSLLAGDLENSGIVIIYKEGEAFLTVDLREGLTKLEDATGDPAGAAATETQLDEASLGGALGRCEFEPVDAEKCAGEARPVAVALALLGDEELDPDALGAAQPAAPAAAPPTGAVGELRLSEPFLIQEGATGRCLFFDAAHQDVHGDYALRAEPCSPDRKFVWTAQELEGDLAAQGFVGLANNGRILDMPGHGSGPWPMGQLIRGYHTQSRDPDQRVRFERLGSEDGAEAVKVHVGDLGSVWTYNAGPAASDPSTSSVIEQNRDEGLAAQRFLLLPVAPAAGGTSTAEEGAEELEVGVEEAAAGEEAVGAELAAAAFAEAEAVLAECLPAA